MRPTPGETPADALAHAGRVRLRPILMTTVCTLAGLVPLALGLGAGAELQRPLALAVIGGLVVSTLVTLLIVPVLLEVVRGAGAARRAVTYRSRRVSPKRAIQSRSSSNPTARQRAAARCGGSSIGSSVSRKVPQWIPSMIGSGRSRCGATGPHRSAPPPRGPRGRSS